MFSFFLFPCLAFVDVSIAGLGLLIVFGSMTGIAICVSIVCLFIPKDTQRQRSDVMLGAVIAGFMGNFLPTLGLIDAFRRSIENPTNRFLIFVFTAAIVLNSALAAFAFKSAWCRR